MKDSKEVQDFVESLYNNADEELNSTYRQKKESRDELLQAIGMILLTYTIVNDVESYIKKNCSLPSDFDFNELESGLIKVLYATIPYNA